MHNLRIVYLAALQFFFINCHGQATSGDIRLKFLEKRIMDSTFLFGKWTKDGGTETHVRYLGQFETNFGRSYKAFNWTWIWGQSQRATSRILFFDNSNSYIGHFNVSLVTDLPTLLTNNKLIFKNAGDSNCDKNISTVVDLSKGIPKQFFRKCKEDKGDIYVLSSAGFEQEKVQD